MSTHEESSANGLDLVGFLPAAGRATRLGEMAWSKEMLPVPGQADAAEGQFLPVCRELLEAYRRGGVRQSLAVLRPEKRDLLGYLTAAPPEGMTVGVISVPGGTSSVPATIDKAYPFLRGSRVAFGFPDCLFRPANAFGELARRQEETAADVVLGLFRVDRPEITDMVDWDEDGRVREIQVRPPQTTLEFNWLLAVWGPRFTELLHDKVEHAPAVHRASEFQLGTLFQAALQAGLSVHAVPFTQGEFLDIGTHEGYAKAFSR